MLPARQIYSVGPPLYRVVRGLGRAFLYLSLRRFQLSTPLLPETAAQLQRSDKSASSSVKHAVRVVRTMKFEEKLAMSMRRSWEEYYLDYKVCSAR